MPSMLGLPKENFTLKARPKRFESKFIFYVENLEDSKSYW